MFQIASDLRFAIRITNRNRNPIARVEALRPEPKTGTVRTGPASDGH